MQDSLPPLIRMQVHDKSKINPLLGKNLIITQRNFQESTYNINSDHQNNKNIHNTIPPFVSYFFGMMRGRPLLLLFIAFMLLFCCAIFIINRLKSSSIKVKKCKNISESEILNP